MTDVWAAIAAGCAVLTVLGAVSHIYLRLYLGERLTQLERELQLIYLRGDVYLGDHRALIHRIEALERAVWGSAGWPRLPTKPTAPPEPPADPPL